MTDERENVTSDIIKCAPYIDLFAEIVRLAESKNPVSVYDALDKVLNLAVIEQSLEKYSTLKKPDYTMKCLKVNREGTRIDFSI